MILGTCVDRLVVTAWKVSMGFERSEKRMRLH